MPSVGENNGISNAPRTRGPEESLCSVIASGRLVVAHTTDHPLAFVCITILGVNVGVHHLVIQLPSKLIVLH